jgi:hypothetical protein
MRRMRAPWARAVSGQVAAAPPTKVMNSRRLIVFAPEAQGTHPSGLSRRTKRAPNVSFGSKADIAASRRDVHFIPENGHRSDVHHPASANANSKLT